jgi:hypothetical protein
VIHSRAPYWDLPLKKILIVAAIGCAVTLVLQVLILRLKFWSVQIANFFMFSLCSAYGVYAFSMNLFWYSAFALLCPFVFYFISAGLQTEMRRSFLDPKKSWFEGAPQVLPRVSCVWTEEQQWSAGVSRVDREGAFIVLPQGRESGLQTQMIVELVFSNGTERTRCHGRVMRIADQGRSIGIKFNKMTFEESQRWGDFVEQLRGKGYA